MWVWTWFWIVSVIKQFLLLHFEILWYFHFFALFHRCTCAISILYEWATIIISGWSYYQRGIISFALLNFGYLFHVLSYFHGYFILWFAFSIFSLYFYIYYFLDFLFVINLSVWIKHFLIFNCHFVFNVWDRLLFERLFAHAYLIGIRKLFLLSFLKYGR